MQRRRVSEPFVNDVTSWVDPRGRTLSDRIWANRGALRDAIDAILRQGIIGGESVGNIAETLLTYVSPNYARYGSGKARHAALRLAQHETRRAHSLGTRDTALMDPAGGFLRYQTSAGHAVPDECSDLAGHLGLHGRGIYPARDCPLPPRHVGCNCSVSQVGVDSTGMDAFVQDLRREYGLGIEPEGFTDAELAHYRQETQKLKDEVVVMFGAWFEQTGVVSRAQMMEPAPTVRHWVDRVTREKQQRRGGR